MHCLLAGLSWIQSMGIPWESVRDFFRYREDAPLIFTGLEFWIFFGIFLVCFGFSYQRKGIRNLVILVFSLFFYFKSSGWAVLLLVYTINQDYWIARGMDSVAQSWVRKLLISLSVVFNLLILAYFKYAFLLADFFNSLPGPDIPKYNWLASILPGRDLLQLDLDNILLPVGISFFIFHTLSYTIDVYRGIVKPLRNWVDFAVFVAFFPELVAGPIVRARDFVDQLKSPYKVDRIQFGTGLFLILGGLCKKIVLSDMISTGIVDRVFDQPGLASPIESWFSVYGYGIQIFCDFSGYTDIAIGLALILGFHLKPNFDQPYKSLTITEFWRRWHISLSVWLRDYLYIPLGGNRKGKFRTYLHLLITMLLGGLWHGANLKFLVWGGLHGLALALHKLWLSVPGNPSRYFPKAFAWLVTFHFVLLCWIPFRADSFDTSQTLFENLWRPWNWELVPQILGQYASVLGLLAAGLFLHFLPDRWKNEASLRFSKAPIWMMGILTLISLILIYQFKTAESQPFIYFQF